MIARRKELCDATVIFNIQDLINSQESIIFPDIYYVLIITNFLSL